MSDASGGEYAFAEGVPIEPVPPGTTLLVAGPGLSRAEDLARTMVTDGTDRDDGMLFISTNMTAKKLLAACRRGQPSLRTQHLGIIDCSGQDLTRPNDEVDVKYVSTQSDLTGIGMKFSALYESLYQTVPDGRVRTGLISLSSLLMYVDLRKLFRFAQTLSGRIDSADGLGVFAVDPTTHDTQTVNTLGQVADGRIEVRETDGDADGELRIRGLRDQPDGWQPFTLP